ncbi:hypothetical protein RB195_004013 [Necator americanus]|uniref:Reverse transcriptase domain-containing protein n=1 Tax=Necator americanus TaxID=51031 RepID=A0ABR1DRC6_NECAM
MPLCLTFIDLKKVFDSVETETVMEALNNQGVPTQYIKLNLQNYAKRMGLGCPIHAQRDEHIRMHQIAATILAHESDVLARKTLEAFHITAKSPIMNRKEECIAVTNDLAPYQDLCRFCPTGSEAGASLLVTTSGATLTTGGPLTSRFRGYQAQDALRRFHHYGLNNIYGIKSLNRRHIASFPIIHAVDTLDPNGTLVAEDTQSTVFTVDPDIPDGMLEEFPNTKHTYIGSVKVPKKSQSFLSRGENSGKHVDVTDRLANFGAHKGMSVQLIEIRKVKRVGGGYPYGPKNFSVTEFMPPLRAEKPTEGIEEIVFKTHYYHKKNQSISSDVEDIWAVQVGFVFLKYGKEKV